LQNRDKRASTRANRKRQCPNAKKVSRIFCHERSQKVALLRQGFGGPGQAGSAFAFDRGIPVSLRAALRPWRKKIRDFPIFLFKIICGIGYSIF
jgi:hypothetical protein